jgi:hypothetical protein
VKSGEGVATQHIKESGTTLGLAGTPQAVLTRRVIAPAGAKIYVQASNANVSCQLSGDVVSPDNTESALTTAITAATTFAAAGTGATDRTIQNKMRDIVSVKDFGAAGDGVTDDTVAIQAVLNTFASSTATANYAVYFPAGTYKITSSLLPKNSSSFYELRGDGTNATKIKWGGSAGSPMIKLRNARQVTIRDMAFDGDSAATPTCAIEVNRCSGQTGAPAATGCRFINLDLGGAAANNCASGILYTCDSTFDSSNDFGYFEMVRVQNVTNYGIAFQHSNALEHVLIACSFASCMTAAVSNIGGANSLVTKGGGSFVAYGCVSGGCGTTLELFGAQHSISIYGWHAENDTKAITTPYAITTTTLNFSAHDFYWVGIDGTAIQFDASTGSTMDFYSPRLAAPATFNISLPTTGSRFNMFGGRLALSTLTYNNEVTFRNVYQEAGNPTYTNSGSGSLTLTRSAGTTKLDAMPIHTSGATFDVNGISADCIYLTYGGATNLTTITGGYPGMLITFYATNANATIQHGTGTNNIQLQGAVNFAMANANTVTLRRIDNAGSSRWVEVGRKT